MNTPQEQRASIAALQEKVADLCEVVRSQASTLTKLEETLPHLARGLLQVQSLRALPIVIAQILGELALSSPEPRRRLDELLFAMSGPAESSLSNPEVIFTSIQIAKLHDAIRGLAEEHVAKHSK